MHHRWNDKTDLIEREVYHRLQMTRPCLKGEMDYLGQGAAENTALMRLGQRKVKMLHADPKTMQEASAVNVAREELCEHSQTFIDLHEAPAVGADSCQ